MRYLADVIWSLGALIAAGCVVVLVLLREGMLLRDESAPLALRLVAVDSGAPGQPEAMPATPARNCAVAASAHPQAGALVRLMLSAPCRPNAQLRIHHNGLVISERTDMRGQLRRDLPALSSAPVFVLAFADGNGVVVQGAAVGSLLPDRSILQWQGFAGVELHALEFGADYESDGHVWTGAPREDGASFMMHLGRSDAPVPFQAEIYTHPVTHPNGSHRRPGTIELIVEARADARNCGRVIEAQLMTIRAGQAETRDIDIPMPDCTAIGSFLIADDLIEDIVIVPQ